jgi:hypothetical protein
MGQGCTLPCKQEARFCSLCPVGGAALCGVLNALYMAYITAACSWQAAADLKYSTTQPVQPRRAGIAF